MGQRGLQVWDVFNYSLILVQEIKDFFVFVKHLIVLDTFE